MVFKGEREIKARNLSSALRAYGDQVKILFAEFNLKSIGIYPAQNNGVVLHVTFPSDASRKIFEDVLANNNSPFRKRFSPDFIDWLNRASKLIQTMHQAYTNNASLRST